MPRVALTMLLSLHVAACHDVIGFEDDVVFDEAPSFELGTCSNLSLPAYVGEPLGSSCPAELPMTHGFEDRAVIERDYSAAFDDPTSSARWCNTGRLVIAPGHRDWDAPARSLALFDRVCGDFAMAVDMFLLADGTTAPAEDGHRGSIVVLDPRDNSRFLRESLEVRQSSTIDLLYYLVTTASHAGESFESSNNPDDHVAHLGLCRLGTRFYFYFRDRDFDDAAERGLHSEHDFTELAGECCASVGFTGSRPLDSDDITPDEDNEPLSVVLDRVAFGTINSLSDCESFMDSFMGAP